MGALLGQVGLSGSCGAPERFRAAVTAGLQHGESAQEVLCSATVHLARWGGEDSLAENGLRIVMDGTLHARRDLAQSLGLDDIPRSAELLALAWRKWGMSAPKHLYGDFAAVLHDGAQGRVILLRDHVGTRPLYWHFANGVLRFATFLPDLLALLPARPGVDESAVSSFLLERRTIGAQTFFAGVNAVEAGHVVDVDTDGARAVRWWHPEEAPEIRFPAADDYGEAFRALTESAVAERVPSDKRVGAHLSGGIDSTTVALMTADALRAQGRDLVGAYCWSPPISAAAPEMRPDDERLRVEKIGDLWRLPLRFGHLGGLELRQHYERPIELEGLAGVFDEASLLEQAAGDGAQVIMSGWGGDEAFSNAAYALPALSLSRGWLPTLLRYARGRGGLRRPDLMAKFVWNQAFVPLLPDKAFNRLGPFSRVLEGGTFPSADHLRSHPPQRTHEQVRYTRDPRAYIRSLLMLGHVGERMATWAARSAPLGIEYRYPLADRRIVEFVLGVPPHILWADGYGRFLAREAAKKHIRSGLTKSDPANERKRSEAYWACWRILREEARSGRFDGDCAWLDMPALRRTLLDAPDRALEMDRGTYARIHPAIRIWHMAERFGAVKRPG